MLFFLGSRIINPIVRRRYSRVHQGQSVPKDFGKRMVRYIRGRVLLRTRKTCWLMVVDRCEGSGVEHGKKVLVALKQVKGAKGW